MMESAYSHHDYLKVIQLSPFTSNQRVIYQVAVENNTNILYPMVWYSKYFTPALKGAINSLNTKLADQIIILTYLKCYKTYDIKGLQAMKIHKGFLNRYLSDSKFYGRRAELWFDLSKIVRREALKYETVRTYNLAS